MKVTSTELVRYQMYVGGERVNAVSAREYESLNPYTLEPWAVVPDGDAADVDRAVAAARAALDGPWGSMTGFDRAKLLRKLGDILARDADYLGELESRDNGKLVRESVAQAHYLPEWYYYFAGCADKIEGEVIPSDHPNYLVYTTHEPIGVVGALVSWNSPLLLMSFKLAPGLAAGCTFVVKPSNHTPATTLEFADRMAEAGFPPGVFNVVTGDRRGVGRAIASHPGIDKVAFTGSTATGIQVGHSAMDNLTRCTLELGGKSAQVVFEDCDMDAAIKGIAAGVFAAAGQTCMAGSRVVVEESVYDEVIERLVTLAGTIRLGDPMDTDTQMGPLANASQHEKVLALLASASAEGASFACGGRAHPDLGGYFVEPTVVTDVTPEMTIVQDEVFGPVVCVLPFSGEDDAVAKANATKYGLAGGVWTENIRRGHRVAHRMKAGTIWINGYRVVAPNVPFGGYKASGVGRENGLDAVRHYTETKAIWVEIAGAARDPFIPG